jgi:hypothetical protein
MPGPTACQVILKHNATGVTDRFEAFAGMKDILNGTVGWSLPTGAISIEKTCKFALALAPFVATFCILPRRLQRAVSLQATNVGW